MIATVEMPADQVAKIRAAAESGEPQLHWFEVPITLESDGTVVALQRRQIYVRKLRAAAKPA